MKVFFKRYAFFFALLLIQAFLLRFFPETGLKSLRNIKGNIQEMLCVIPPVFLLLGLLDVWVDRQTVIKYTGPGSALRGALLSLFLGSAAAGPLYAAFPVASMMLKKGSSIFNVFLFIGAWSTTKIPMLTFEGGSLGLPFMLIRLCLSLIGIVITAAVINRSLSSDDKEEIYHIHAS